MPRLERIESQDTAPPPQQAAVLPDRKTVTPLPADDNGKRKIPLGAGGNKQSSSNTQQKKKAKTQKQKKEKDPNRPKKKRNAYDFWQKGARNNLPPNNTGVKLGYQGKALGEQWRAMSKQDKAPWEEEARKDKIRYENEMKVYEANKNKNNGPDEKKKTAAKNVEGTIQLASMPVVSNPAVDGQRQKALARAMGEEDTKKSPSNAKGTTTEFINAKVVNNNSNDAPLPTAASQKSIESVDIDILVDDPSHEEEKLMKVPIKKGSSITTNNGNKENNNNRSSKAAAGKGGGLMASAKSGVTRLFNKGKSEEQTKAYCDKDTVGGEEGGMDKVDGKDGEQKSVNEKKLDEKETSQQPTEPSNDDDDDNTQQSEDLLGGCQDEETPVAANTSNHHDKTAPLDLPQAPSVLAKLTLTPMNRDECASSLMKLKGRPHEQPDYLSPVPEKDENQVRKAITLEKKEEDVACVSVDAGLYKLTLGRSSTTAIKSTLISRSLCTVSMPKGDAATASVAMLKEPDGHAVFLNGDPLNEPVGKEIKLCHDDILSLYGPAGFAYRVQLSQKEVSARSK